MAVVFHAIREDDRCIRLIPILRQTSSIERIFTSSFSIIFHRSTIEMRGRELNEMLTSHCLGKYDLFDIDDEVSG